jgi:hypothetical protein
VGTSKRPIDKTPDYKILEQQLQEESNELQSGSRSLITEAENQLRMLDNDLHRFNLATLYIRSKLSPKHVERGIQYIADILSSERNSELLQTKKKYGNDSKTASNHYKRDCMYYMALGFYNLDDYVKSKQWLETLLKYDPGNRQAKTLLELVEAKIHDEGVKGLAIAGGALAGAGIVAGVLGLVAYALIKK